MKRQMTRLIKPQHAPHFRLSWNGVQAIWNRVWPIRGFAVASLHISQRFILPMSVWYHVGTEGLNGMSRTWTGARESWCPFRLRYHNPLSGLSHLYGKIYLDSKTSKHLSEQKFRPCWGVEVLQIQDPLKGTKISVQFHYYVTAV